MKTIVTTKHVARVSASRSPIVRRVKVTVPHGKRGAAKRRRSAKKAKKGH